MVVTAELATKRLQSANGTQDGIETISTWMLHHTDSFRVLSDCWLNLFRTESEDRRVVLFYIMNDVVQRAKKKHVDSVCAMFEQPVIAAVALGRFSEKLRGVMSRCLTLIAECKAFSTDGLLKMNKMIADPNGDADDGNYEVDVIELAKKIEAFMKGVDTITKGYEVIKRSPQNFEEQIQTRMKDRKEGAILLKETKTSILRLEKFGEAVTNNTKRLYEFVDAIETAKRLFNMQLRDVAVVEDAYVKFGQGVREVQEEIEEMLRTGVYPAGSPPRDAPSPSAEDDVFAAGVEQVLNKMRPQDLTDEADMDVDDDEPPMPSQWKPTPTVPSRPSVLERAAALATHIPALASHMGIDPRSRANTLPTASSAAAAAPPPAKKPTIDSAALQQVFARAAASIPSLHQNQTGYPTAPPPASTAAPPSSFSVPPPLFAPNIPPPSPAIVAQFMAMQQQQQQQQTAAAAAPLAVHTMHASVPSAPPPISPYSAPPPGYPAAGGGAAPAAQQYMQPPPVAHQQQQQQQNRPQHQQQQQSHYSPPAATGYAGYGGAAATAGYQQSAAAATQQQYGAVQQQGQKKYSTMPEYGRSNSNPAGSLQSPTGAATTTYAYPMHNTPSTPAGSSAAAAAAGTPYTPTAPGLMGRKGSEGAGGYGRGGGSQLYNAYGAGYGTPIEEQSEDAYQPQHVVRQNSFGGQDSDFRQQQQQQRGGGTPRGYGRGTQGGYGRFQRGGPRGGRGGGGGYGSQQQQNYGGGYNNQGY